jgi:osmotically-inducible protein OsmY
MTTEKNTCRSILFAPPVKQLRGDYMIQNRFLCTGLVACGLAFIGPALAQDTGATQPDNTKVNQRDRGQAATTADQQKNSLSDRQLTQQIRKALVADKSLSTYAHNVKIISQNGTVTLKGPVRSEDEKKTIVAKAAEIAGGTDKVTDDLSVKP